MNDRRILVTGASGVIGQELIKKLDSKKANVLAIDKTDFPGNVSEKTHSIKSDIVIDNIDAVREFKPHVIYHLAATFERTEESPSFWDHNWRNNTRLTHRIFDLALDLDSLDKLIFASSYLVYDSGSYLSSTVPVKPIKIDEDFDISPRNLCGASKYFAENELDFLNRIRPDLRTISARIFRVYGRGSKDVISRWVRASLKGHKITVYNEESSFDFIHARDVAEGLIRIDNSDEVPNILNLGRGRNYSISEVLSAISDEVPGGFSNIEHRETTHPIESTVSDISKLHKNVGWAPPINLKTGIRDIVKFERHNLNI